MQKRCPEHQVIGNGVLNGYRWTISSRGVANVVRSERDKVYGMVYQISESDESTLDECEGVKHGDYEKCVMEIDIGGTDQECLVYVDPIQEEGKPLEEYVTRINNGLRDSALPEDYVEKYIRPFIPLD